MLTQIFEQKADIGLLQIMFTAMLRHKLAGRGRVAFYALNPGEVMTDVIRSLPSYIGQLYRLLLKQILLTPMEGTPKCSCARRLAPQKHTCLD